MKCNALALPFIKLVTEDEKKRQQAIEELINTEKTYVDDMVIALEVS